jgi:hypothetical protein
MRFLVVAAALEGGFAINRGERTRILETWEEDGRLGKAWLGWFSPQNVRTRPIRKRQFFFF